MLAKMQPPVYEAQHVAPQSAEPARVRTCRHESNSLLDSTSFVLVAQMLDPGSNVSTIWRVTVDTSPPRPAEAIVLISDGLPNPAFNNNMGPSSLVRNITVANAKPMEIHAVTVGDYFKYRGTVEFMESLARANDGSFLALAQ